jgi:hypothetical protein
MSVNSQFRTLLLVTLLVAATSCGGGGGGGNSANSPVSPGNTTLLGVWTGTITRPDGLGTVSVRWETPNLNDYSLTGPVTLSNSSGATAELMAQGNTAGNDNNGYTIWMSFQSNAVAPNCTVRGATSGSQQGDPFPAPYRTITVPAFSITWIGCAAFVGSINLAETVQLNLVKQ